MKYILDNIDKEINERNNVAFIAAYNIEVEKAKSENHGEIKGLELAKQIILSEKKEPCEYCGYAKRDKTRLGYGWQEARFCPMCGCEIEKSL